MSKIFSSLREIQERGGRSPQTLRVGRPSGKFRGISLMTVFLCLLSAVSAYHFGLVRGMKTAKEAFSFSAHVSPAVSSPAAVTGVPQPAEPAESGNNIEAVSPAVISEPEIPSLPDAALPGPPEEEQAAAETVPEVTTPEKAGKPFFEGPLYTVQVVAYRDDSQAREVVTRFESLGYESFVLPQSGLYQVCVGKLSSWNEANRFLAGLRTNALKSSYSDAYVRRAVLAA